MPALTIDPFHSHLLDRIALRDGLVRPEKWHAMPSDSDDGDAEMFHRRLVEENFTEFSSVRPWNTQAERLLTTLALFPDVRTSHRTFEWTDPALVEQDFAFRLSDIFEPEAADAQWKAAVGGALTTLKLGGLTEIVHTMFADPDFTFKKCFDLAQEWPDDLEDRRYELSTLLYWSKALNKRIIASLEGYYRDLPTGHLPSRFLPSDQDSETILANAGVVRGEVGIYRQLQDLCSRTLEHLDAMILLELERPRDALCTNIAHKRTPGLAELGDTAMLVRADFSHCLSVVPAPRTIEEAVELRHRKEVSRLAELIHEWTRAVQSSDIPLENRISRDIARAQRELRTLDRIRELTNSELGIWVKCVGGQIPLFSNILSAAEVALFYLDRWRRDRNVWVSTNPRSSDKQ